MAECRAPDCTMPTSRLLCDACLTHAARNIGLLAMDHDDLGEHLAATSRGGGAIHGAPGARIPIDLGVDELQRRIWWLTTAWHEVVRDRVDDQPMPMWTKRTRPAVAVTNAIAYIVRHLAQLAAVERVELWAYPGSGPGAVTMDGWQGILDLSRCHEQALRLLGLTAAAPERCHGVPCPSCDLDCLVRDGDAVRCTACGRRLHPEDYARWTRQLVAVHQSDDRHSVSG